LPAPAVPPLASGLGQVADLKRRLKMILRGSTPPALGRSAGLAVLGLAVLLLPLVPGWGRGQEAGEEKRAVLGLAVWADDDAELARLKDELKKQMAEVEQLRKKIEEAARARAADARKKATDVRERAVREARTRTQEALERAGVARGKAGPVIRIEISGIK